MGSHAAGAAINVASEQTGETCRRSRRDIEREIASAIAQECADVVPPT
jgi:hypothetical protein